MSCDLLYLIGPPAAGKSTLMRRLTAGCDRLPRNMPVAHSRLVHPATGHQIGAELGYNRPDFPGTDTLAMGISPAACEWVRSGDGPRLLLGEGDRLAHVGFLAAAVEGGYRVTVGYLDADLEVLDARCAARGSKQSASWRAGRATKSSRLAATAEQLGYPVVRLDATEPTPILAARLRDAVAALTALPERT